MARDLQVSPATLSLLETGHLRFTEERLQEVAATLEVDTSHFLAASRGLTIANRAAGGGIPVTPTQSTLQDWRIFAPLATDVVLDAALRCFAESGYSAASMRDIAKVAGLSVPGVYHHHESKQQMLGALVLAASREALWRVRAARETGQNAVSRFALMVEALCLFHLCRRDLATVSLAEMPHLAAEDFALVSPMRWAVQDLIDVEILACVEAGIFRTREPAEAGRAVVMLASALPRRHPEVVGVDVSDVARRYTRFALAIVEVAHEGAAGLDDHLDEGPSAANASV